VSKIEIDEVRAPEAFALMMSAFGVKRTWLFALHVSAYDPKRTFNRRDIKPKSM
jgi:phenylpropionate dioxygenase-like ring-hydroxylating dioxygenase large terminal subunit